MGVLNKFIFPGEGCLSEVKLWIMREIISKISPFLSMTINDKCAIIKVKACDKQLLSISSYFVTRIYLSKSII